jgi:hypothetical protein
MLLLVARSMVSARPRRKTPSPVRQKRARMPDKENQDMTMDDFLASTEAMIARWHGITVPNEPARRLALELEHTIRAFEAQRGTLQFEDEPASFEAALLETRDSTP